VEARVEQTHPTWRKLSEIYRTSHKAEAMLDVNSGTVIRPLQNQKAGVVTTTPRYSLVFRRYAIRGLIRAQDILADGFSCFSSIYLLFIYGLYKDAVSSPDHTAPHLCPLRR
jgi:hypothetical protein